MWTLTSSSYVADRSGLVAASPIAERENPGSNLTAGSCVYHDSQCDIQPWARAARPYGSA